MRWRTVQWRLALGLACAATGCKDDDAGGSGDGTQGSDDTSSGSGAAVESTSGTSTTTELADSTGDTTGVPPEIDWSFEPVFGVINDDDDDGNGSRDWLQIIFEGEDDHSVIPIPALPEGHRVRLEIAGDVDGARVWHGTGELAVGSGDGEVLPTYDFAGSPEGDELQVEFGADNVFATLTLAVDDDDGNEVATADVELRSSPMILNHHLQPTEHVWVVAVDAGFGNNNAMIDAFAAALGDRFTAVPGQQYQEDVWIQDEIQLSTGIGSQGQRVDTVIDSIRNRGLDPFAEQELEAPDVNVRTWGNPADVTSWDSFGNLENTPPLTVDGVEYPLGRTYYGKLNNLGLHEDLSTHLAAQGVQAPIERDTLWLCVGHVDEYESFVPDPESPKGFRYIISDVPAAWALLEGLDSGTQLTRYAADHGYATVGEILRDVALRNLNDDLQADELDPLLAQAITEWGLEESDIIRLPSLFEEIPGCGGTVAALVPAMVNLIVAPLENGETHIFTADPFFRVDVDDPSSDPFIASFEDLLPPSLTHHFVDDWDVYHLGLGEVHCATNMTQTPMSNWWETALHLL